MSISIPWRGAIETGCAMNRKQALAIYRAGRDVVVAKLCELSATVTEQERKIAALQKNSSNSSKPPSSDIIKPPKEHPGKGGKNKRGG